MLHKNVVKPELLDLYYELKKEPLFKDYILAGGTALALQLGHRTSTDIDLFTTQNYDIKVLLKHFDEKYKYYDVLPMHKDILRVVLKNIVVDLVKIKQNIIETPKTEDGITYFGKKDIAGMKLNALLTRCEPRDYMDIVYLMKEMSLRNIFKCYKKKFGIEKEIFVKRALLNCKQFEEKDWKKGIILLNNDIDLNKIPVIIEYEYNKMENPRSLHNIVTGFTHKICGQRGEK